MNFYQFHIGDYIKHTPHLSPDEDLTYRRLLDMYYDTEQPIPNNIPSVSRRLRMGSDVVESVLAEFFQLTPEGYRNLRADQEIADYYAYLAKQKANGRKGGRPKKQKVTPNKNPDKPTANPDVTQSEPKKSLTITHEPETIVSLPAVAGATAVALVDDDDIKLARFIYQRVLSVQPKVKAPNFIRWANTIRLMRQQDGRTHKQIQDVFIWANKDDFWKANIMSPDSLRKQIDKLEVQMQNKGKTGQLGMSMADRMAHETYKHLIDEGGVDANLLP